MPTSTLDAVTGFVAQPTFAQGAEPHLAACAHDVCALAQWITLLADRWP
ncbi:hypothetical protein ACIRJR_36215 [Streptomyces sp. NPDC102402]